LNTGLVSLVGAGPGDPGLITVAGLDRIRDADVIVYDRLVSKSLLDHARPDAELIYAGKVPGHVAGEGEESTSQDAINDLLVERARAGKRVVRLKGGDPFVFGRGGEEAQVLRDAGLAFEVVPGVTSAVAVPAYAGIPVTHRGVAASFAVITGHEDPGKPESALDWPALARGADTLVFLMGMKNLAEITAGLIGGGRAATTPAAVVQSGTTPQQRTVSGTLETISELVAEAGITPPAITIVGEVAGLRDTLSWFETRPLFGKRVLITRTRRQAGRLAQLLAAEGAIPIELPVIEIEPMADSAALGEAIDRLCEGVYAWCGFTSANGAELFFERLDDAGFDARAFGRTRVFAIGPATAEALHAHGVKADVVPEEYVAEGVVEAMTPHIVAGDRVLLPRAESARASLVAGLERLEASVEEIPVYVATLPADPDPETLAALREGRIDIVTFTSSSTVRNLLSMLGSDASVLRGKSRPLIACIGPVTAETARENGLTVDVMAEEYTVEGLLEALRRHVTAESKL
jgi:uroporphyrinogen III methyltransferase/synthase